jgi:hypothetical protein
MSVTGFLIASPTSVTRRLPCASCCPLARREEARRLQASAATALQRLGAPRPGLAGGAA